MQFNELCSSCAVGVARIVATSRHAQWLLRNSHESKEDYGVAATLQPTCTRDGQGLLVRAAFALRLHELARPR